MIDKEGNQRKIILSMREQDIGYLYEYKPILPTLFDKRFRFSVYSHANKKALNGQSNVAFEAWLGKMIEN